MLLDMQEAKCSRTVMYR